MRKILSVFLCMVLIVSMTACRNEGGNTGEVNTENTGSVQQAEETEASKEIITLVYAEVNPLDTIAGQTAKAFKEKVEELSEMLSTCKSIWKR